MYCRNCKYDLHGNAGAACPECGRAFDAGDPRTWDPIPSRPWLSLAILVAALGALIVTQLVLGVLRPVMPDAVATLDWLLPVLAPLGAFAAGWYADRRAAILAYGGLSCFVVVFAAYTNTALAVYVGGTTLLLQSLVGTAASLAWMLGCWLVGRLAWASHVRIERRRRAASGAERGRRGPRPRTVLLALALAAALTVGWGANEVRRTLNATPNMAIDYAGRGYALRLEATGGNARESIEAWDRLAAAMAEVYPLYRELRFGGGSGARRSPRRTDFERVRRGRTLPADIGPERKLIEAFRDAGFFAALRDQIDGPMALTPMGVWGALWPAQNVVIARVASMRIAAAAGNFDECAQGFEDVLAISRTMSYQDTRHAIPGGMLFDNAATELRHDLMEFEFPEPVCVRLLRSIERMPHAPPELALEWALIEARGTIQARFSDDGHGDGYRLAAPAPLSVEALRDAFARRFRLPSRRDETERCEAEIDAAIVVLALSPDERSGVPHEEFPDEARYLVAPGVIAQTRALLWGAMTHRRQVETTRLVVAVSIFRARHGRYPERLDELVPDVVDVLPLDPMTGKSFGYRRRAGDRTDRPFVLYGFGPDGVDDGGSFAAPDERASPAPGAGTDELLTPPRPPRKP